MAFCGRARALVAWRTSQFITNRHVPRGSYRSVSSAGDFGTLLVPQLKEQLRVKGLSTSGRKAELVARLEGSGGGEPPERSATTFISHDTLGVCDGAGDAWDRAELVELRKQYSNTGGERTGLFTDGSCEPNPGPGGWAWVKVKDNVVCGRARGQSAPGEKTTNNAMEWTALAEGLEKLPLAEEVTVWTDSMLCVNTLTKWADDWEANGWRRGSKKEEVKNVNLVRRAHAALKLRPRVKVQWVKAHTGALWNEYADRLAGAWRTAATKSSAGGDGLGGGI